MQAPSGMSENRRARIRWGERTHQRKYSMYYINKPAKLTECIIDARHSQESGNKPNRKWGVRSKQDRGGIKISPLHGKVVRENSSEKKTGQILDLINDVGWLKGNENLDFEAGRLLWKPSVCDWIRRQKNALSTTMARIHTHTHTRTHAIQKK